MQPCIQPFAVRQGSLPIDPVFAIALAFSRVIGRIRIRYARDLLAPLLAYSLPILCLFCADWLLFNYHFSRETAKKHQRNTKETANE